MTKQLWKDHEGIYIVIDDNILIKTDGKGVERHNVNDDDLSSVLADLKDDDEWRQLL